MSEHGPQFDEFPSNRSDTHGGATFDEGFNSFAAAHTNAHGKLFDKFSKRPGVDRYGEHWDNFPWKDVPSLYGQHHDEGFDSPTFEGGEHGRLHDVFRGSRVRYMYGGQDVEGVVLDTQRGFAVVESREGDRHEVTLPQILQYATDSGQPSDPAGRTAEPATVDTSIVTQKPSAPANGGERTEGGSYDDSVVTHVKSLGEALEVVKTLDRPFDEAEFDRDVADFAEVAKSFVGVHHMSTKKLTEAHAKFSDHYTAAKMTGNHDRASFAAQVLASTHAELHARGVMAEKPDEGSHPVTRGLSAGHQPLRNKSATDDADVSKDMDSEETAVQGDTNEGANWCKTCQHYCRKVEAGKCPTCGGPVGVKKSWMDELDVLKGEEDPDGSVSARLNRTPIGRRFNNGKVLCPGCSSKQPSRSGPSRPVYKHDGNCGSCGKAMK
jgi:hypothetical protein